MGGAEEAYAIVDKKFNFKTLIRTLFFQKENYLKQMEWIFFFFFG